ncbi:MAG: phosphoribosylaminoimidazolesuccinocarboxamide synthase [Christensenellales bacterium]|jgi:phosphoribosylaminoimidazole-succinocarboxamide synthase|nr:phosphoribosylaminoimidazolesuccinocarboxamide synthase [Clostridia bacterium]HRU83822.1 phosphoribosylaminoimidazolesuccinocarboxamide synthase [Eubacteriales bacterium]
MKALNQIYEGKAKKVFATDDPDVVLVSYKDDATAFNGLKKGQIAGKGVINNRISNQMFKLLESRGIKTHYLEEVSPTDTYVRRVRIVPIEVIVRNIAAGSLAKRLGVPEGTVMKSTVLEFCYKNDELGDPMINEYHALAMEFATKEEIEKITSMSFKINEVLREYLKGAGIDLIDFKLEFGRYKGDIILADEISPDTCRFWDMATREKLDKDRFRRDLGGVEEAYREVMARLFKIA